jgi:pimeloyl-ACP methyl ester carboxylesterase
VNHGVKTCDGIYSRCILVQPVGLVHLAFPIFLAWTPAANSLMIAERIPGLWLVQIKDAGHGLMYQYPDKFSKVISTFLQTVT